MWTPVCLPVRLLACLPVDLPICLPACRHLVNLLPKDCTENILTASTLSLWIPGFPSSSSGFWTTPTQGSLNKVYSRNKPHYRLILCVESVSSSGFVLLRLLKQFLIISTTSQGLTYWHTWIINKKNIKVVSQHK
ncbi:hypothetical protein AMECASPLE_021115 [Ameca splendens]|uniref:Secreted protein n=1 Tax=Ameca splendens TaxID=208324 RepID=A0ABV0XSD0_9TELE